MLGVAYNPLLGFMNSTNTKLLNVTKSFVNKSFNKLVKKSFGIDFFKLVHSSKILMACVNITKLQSSISSLEMCIVYLSNARFSLFIFASSQIYRLHGFV